MPRVWNKRLHNVPPEAVYVGRPSNWGNPYVLGKDGARGSTIARFEAYARGRLGYEPDWLAPLVGKDLVCWCSPDPCHADVLMRLIDEHYAAA